jgi:hypothetical protein
VKRNWTWYATRVVISVVVLGLIAWDVYVFIEPSEGDTISEATLSWAWRSAFVAFALGVLGGHFTWPRCASARFRKWSAIGLAIVGVLLIVGDVLNFTPNVMPIWYFVPGVIAGHLFWPQQQMEARRG